MGAKSYEILRGHLKVFVSPVHNFGADALLLAEFASRKKVDSALDMCAGCGIVAFLLCIDGVANKVTAVELQEEAAKLAKKTLKLGGLEEKVLVVCNDLRDWALGCKERFDLVTCNPPYKIVGTGPTCGVRARDIARYEIMCDINSICKAAQKLLKPGGRFCLCQRQDRLLDTMLAMRANRIEPKRVCFVSCFAKKAPWLFLIEGQKGAKPGMKVEPSLFLKEDELAAKIEGQQKNGS